LENVICRSKFVAQAYVHGDPKQSFLVAVIIPEEEIVSQWANSKGIKGVCVDLFYFILFYFILFKYLFLNRLLRNW